jgi:hypothetical protein
VGADPPRNFTVPVEERIRALAIGVPAWSARKRRIEDREEDVVGILVAVYDEATAGGAPDHEARALMRASWSAARALDLVRLRKLVADHNRWYPIEANLPFDPSTGDYLVYGRRWTPEPEPTAERYVARAEALLAARPRARGRATNATR